MYVCIIYITYVMLLVNPVIKIFLLGSFTEKDYECNDLTLKI